MKPYVHSSSAYSFIHWNIDCSVGRGGQNSLRADVSYIQWYYTLAAAHPLTPEDRKAVYRNVRVTGSCTGTDNDPLVQAILVHQRHLEHPECDGRVSIARGDGKTSGKAFFVLRIGARIADMYPNEWPRLDKIPRCPPEVAQQVKKAIPVKG